MSCPTHTHEDWVETPLGPAPRTALLNAAKDRAGQLCSKYQASIATLDAQLADLVHKAELRNDSFMKMLARDMQVTIAELQYHSERRYMFTLSEMERAYCGEPCNEVLQHIFADRTRAGVALLDAVKDQADELFSKSRASIATLHAQLADLMHKAELRFDHFMKLLALKMKITIAQLQSDWDRYYVFTLDEMERAYGGGPPNLALQHNLARQALASLPHGNDGRTEERSRAA